MSINLIFRNISATNLSYLFITWPTRKHMSFHTRKILLVPYRGYIRNDPEMLFHTNWDSLQSTFFFPIQNFLFSHQQQIAGRDLF